MAQTTRSSSSRSTSSRSRTNRSTSRNGSSKSSRSTRSRNGTSRTRQAPRRATPNGPVAKTGEKVAELASKAAPQAETVRSTGKKAGELVSKAKTPLIAGGAAVAGVVGGLALKSRTDNRRPVDKLKTRALPRSLRNVDLSKVDLDAITSAMRQVRSFGEQVGDVAEAAEKTRKKHK